MSRLSASGSSHSENWRNFTVKDWCTRQLVPIAYSEVFHRNRESRRRVTGCKTARPPVYCLSYPALFLGLLPYVAASPVVTIRDLPSADTTTRPVTVTFPSFLTVIFITRSPILLYDRMSEVGSPVTA